MAIDEKKVKRVVNDLENAYMINKLARFPNSFYDTLNDAERAEAIRIYRRRKGFERRGPYQETK